MPTIALFDDRDTVRKGLALSFDMATPNGWRFIDSPPLPDPTKYVEWILKEEVQVIVIDWVLDEQANDVNAPVAYKGGIVVSEIRKRLPGMPVFVITAHPGDEDLKEHLGDVEAVFTRAQFSSEPLKFIKPMVRAGERFAKRFQAELSKLSVLSAKAADGTATSEEREELRALQMSMELVSGLDCDVSRSDALTTFESKLSQLESIGNDVRELLKGKRKS